MAVGGPPTNPLIPPKTKPLPAAYYAQVATKWAPAAARFGIFGGILFLYFTDWKIFMDKLPFYGSKFDEEDRIYE